MIRLKAVVAGMLGVAVLGGYFRLRAALPEPAPPPVPVVTRVPPPAPPPAPAPLPPEFAWVVWYGPDGQVYRRPTTDAYRELYGSLQQSLADDQVRLQVLSRTYLRREAEPVLAALAPRLGPFFGDQSGLAAGIGRLNRAIGSADAAVEDGPGPARDGVIRTALLDHLLEAFDVQVLGGGATRQQLRAAAGQVLDLLRSDMLQLCDRYDRAFRWFILHTPGSVWVLADAAQDWRPAQGWRAAGEAIPSLCQSLRLAPAGAGPGTEQALDTALDTLTATARGTFPAYLRRTAQAAAGLARRTDRFAGALQELGLPAGLTRPPARAGAYLASAWNLLGVVREGLGDEQARAELTITLDTALGAVRDTVRLQLHQTLDDYVVAELERMALGLDARSRGAWSYP
jgi:hypothetical protein